MLIQLAWKAEPVNDPAGGNTTMVGSNWKTGPDWKSQVSGHAEVEKPLEPGNWKTGPNWKSQMSGHAEVEMPLEPGKVACSNADESIYAGRLPIKKRIGPSRARRNAKRLQAFQDRKQSLVNHTS